VPRCARIIVPECPHHITQRGNHQEQVFFCDFDRELIINLLRENGEKYGVKYLAYCLMSNHLHLVAIPSAKNSFAKAFGEVFRKYTTIMNIRHGWKGVLWQGRYYSFPLDDAHFHAAVRYALRNPVRAGIVERAEQYPWSNARSQVSGQEDLLVNSRDTNARLGFSKSDWDRYLESEEEEILDQIRQHTRTGRPLGSDEFISKIETLTGRRINLKRRTRKSMSYKINRLEQNKKHIENEKDRVSRPPF